MKLRKMSVAVLMCGVLTGCWGGKHTPDPEDTEASSRSVVTPTPNAPTPLDSDTTQQWMAVIYDSYTWGQQWQLCNGVRLYGHDWTVQALQADVPPQERSGTNWDAAAAYLVARCRKDFG